MTAAEYNAAELAKGNITWDDIANIVELGQGALKVKQDGYFGPVTKEALYGGLPSGVPYAIDDNGLLWGVQVKRILAHPSWFGGPMVPLGIVDHTTDTGPGTAVVMAQNRVTPYVKTKRMASWHLTVDQDGLVVQQVPLTRCAWHAGSDSAKRLPFGWANYCTIGVELVSKDDKDFTQVQIDTYAKVKRAIVQKYGIPRDRAAIAHGSIDPKRRSDPGKMYAEKFNQYVLDTAYAA